MIIKTLKYKLNNTKNKINKITRPDSYFQENFSSDYHILLLVTAFKFNLKINLFSCFLKSQTIVSPPSFLCK